MLLKMKPHSNGKSGCRNWLRFVIFIWTHLLQSGVLMLQWGSLATTNWMNSLCFPKLLKSPRVGSHYLPSLWIVASFCEILYLHLICSGQLSTSPIGEKEQICNFQTSSHLHVNTSRPLAQWAKSHSQTLASPRGFTFTMYSVHASGYDELSDQWKIRIVPEHLFLSHYISTPSLTWDTLQLSGTLEPSKYSTMLFFTPCVGSRFCQQFCDEENL